MIKIDYYDAALIASVIATLNKGRRWEDGYFKNR